MLWQIYEMEHVNCLAQDLGHGKTPQMLAITQLLLLLLRQRSIVVIVKKKELPNPKFYLVGELLTRASKFSNFQINSI